MTPDTLGVSGHLRLLSGLCTGLNWHAAPHCRASRVLLDELFHANSGLLTTAQLLSVFNRRALAAHIGAGALIRVFHGVYAQEPPDTIGRLAAPNCPPVDPSWRVWAPPPNCRVSTSRPTAACMCWTRGADPADQSS